MARWVCTCHILCFPEEIEVEAEDVDEASIEALKRVESCDVEPDCECEEVAEHG